MPETTPPILEYREPSEDDDKAKRETRNRLVVFGLLLPLMVFTCVRIEVLNYQSGGVLPKTYEGKWRADYRRNETRWREMETRDAGDPSLLTRPLTAPEAAKMRAEVARAVAANDLRDVVPLWGIWQYPLALIVLVAGVSLFRQARSRREVLIATVSSAAAVVAGLMAVYRGYFTSIID